MSLTSVNKKRQITLPADAVKEAGILPGTRVRVDVLPDKSLQIRPIRSILNLAGILKPHRNKKAPTIRQLRKIAEKAIAESVMAKGRRR